ncbi:GNAT family N-acetyltransferase [Gordonia soli]|nr:GNAT family N-acetyltransferase [Gordonia soli]
MTTDKTGAETTVTRNDDLQRYEIEVIGSGLAGFTVYRERQVDGGTQRVFVHTEVDEDFGGRGLATILVREALDDTRAQGETIVGVCPLVAAFLRKNPDYAADSAAVSPEILSWLEGRA